jgi:hypothetical protein
MPRRFGSKGLRSGFTETTFTHTWYLCRAIRSLSWKFANGLSLWRKGTVLEIGAGSGANFPHYDLKWVSMLYALEPSPGTKDARPGRISMQGIVTYPPKK